MAQHSFTPPVTADHARSLRVGDTVILDGPLFGLRDATQIHLFDRHRPTRFDLRGHAVLHTAPNVRRVPASPAAPAGYEPICVGTTTSARMERFTRPLMERMGVRLIIGKGGLLEESRQAFQALGGAYLTVMGGAAALETTWVRAIVDVDLDDLNPESLWKFDVRGFGPLLVTMDATGDSLYRSVEQAVAARRDDVLASLGIKP
ncbi:MAG: fumarate hydratase C-terminal domain-containing protein [Acidiferrobacteraceae bacterium]